MKNLIIFLVLVSGMITISRPQSPENIENLNSNLFSGSLYFDAQIAMDEIKSSSYGNSQSKYQLNEKIPGKKSPILAGLMSLIIPGSGEFYAQSYWTAAAFIAIEAAAIIVGLTYDKKGDDKTDEFESFADKNWSVVKYAEWLIDEHLNGQDPGIIISNDESLPPWKRINWNVLNQNEKGSHKLPPHGDQQYYELIGKYHQYTSGWNDYQMSTNIELLTPNFLYYSGLRGKANDYYSVASTAVIVIYVNHFLSALDAVWTAAQFNSNLEMNVRMGVINLHDRTVYTPTLNLHYTF